MKTRAEKIAVMQAAEDGAKKEDGATKHNLSADRDRLQKELWIAQDRIVDLKTVLDERREPVDLIAEIELIACMCDAGEAQTAAALEEIVALIEAHKAADSERNAQ